MISELPNDPSSHALEELRETLRALSKQAEVDEELAVRLAEDAVIADPSANSATTSSALFDPAPVPPSSSSTPGSSGRSSVDGDDSQMSLSTPLGFLRAAFPDIPSSRLRRYIPNLSREEDFDMEDAVEKVLSAEYVRELEERGLESDDEDDIPWEEVGPRGRISRSPSPGATIKTKQIAKPPSFADQSKKPLKRPPKPKATPLISLRQEQHKPPPRSQLQAHIPTADPWTQIASLSARLSELLAPVPASHFSSHFHNPAYSEPVSALRGALDSLPSPNSALNDSTLATLTDILLANEPDAIPSNVNDDALRSLRAARGRADDALDVATLIREMARSGALGVWHSPAEPTRSSAEIHRTSSLPRSPHNPTVSAPVHRLEPVARSISLNGSTSKKRTSNAWTDIPIKPAKGPHPLAASIPAYRYKRAYIGVGPSTVETSRKKRDAALMEAGRAWKAANARNRGGEVALFYAEQVCLSFRTTACRHELNSSSG